MAYRSTAFHRRLLAEAWELAWQRRLLWVFGLFAGLVLSGSTVGLALSGLVSVGRLKGFWMVLGNGQWTSAFTPLLQFILQSSRDNPVLANLLFTMLILLGIAGIMFACLCEGGLIEALVQKKSLPLAAVVAGGWQHSFRLFVLNVIGRGSELILLILVALTVLWYSLSQNIASAFTAILGILFFIPLLTGIYTLVMLASIHAVRKNTHVAASLHVAWTMFSTHWLSAFETGFILLLIDGLGALLFSIITLLLFLPTLFVFSLASTSAWMLVSAILCAVSVLIFSAICCVAAGFLSAFRYAVWVRFYERAVRPLTANRIVAKLKRLFHPMHVV